CRVSQGKGNASKRSGSGRPGGPSGPPPPITPSHQNQGSDAS
ncbi:MAG: hypothetical protein AVDCRST_MAG59-2366, partial [uncultured Thermomicrobiales bacterium]